MLEHMPSGVTLFTLNDDTSLRDHHKVDKLVVLDKDCLSEQLPQLVKEIFNSSKSKGGTIVYSPGVAIKNCNPDNYLKLFSGVIGEAFEAHQ